jgi:hypothetical protein
MSDWPPFPGYPTLMVLATVVVLFLTLATLLTLGVR